MSDLPTSSRRKLEPHWVFIIAFALGALALYAYHLQTGFTPDRAAFSIAALNLQIYWYGIIITAGIALGAYVVTRLAYVRAVASWQTTVPARIRQQPLSSLALPKTLEAKVAASAGQKVGELLFWWGVEPERLGLNAAEREQVAQALLAHDGIQAEWVEKPPWFQWSPNHVWAGLFWCLILALIGARLYHVLTPSPSMGITPADYFQNPLQLINVRRGGLGIYGGIAGGALGLALYTLRQRISALRWADLAVVGVSLGQFIGRWGNFVNQELYGRPTEVPWAVTIDPPYRLPGYESFSRFHPAFLYESLWNLGIFLVLYVLARRYWSRLFPGDLMALYLILYAVGRVLLETVRLDSASVGALPVATLVSLLVAAVMAGWMILRRKRAG